MAKPEDRYVKLSTKTLPDGRVVYKSAITVKPIIDPLNDLTFTAGERDRMDILGKNGFGEATDWWRIAAANGLVNGSLYIRPGTTLVIPSST
jgi:ABC-type polysaccharide/polyol phosphate transport system ATPase subunit